jgi:nicotinate dehydrogenase subunit A
MKHMTQITLLVNGKSKSINVDDDIPLLYALRDDLGMKGPKFG